jgi:arabinose-5-phosphate isomerase
MEDKIRELLSREVDAVSRIPVDDSYRKALDIIYHRVHELRGKVVVSGMGKAGQIAISIATTFSSTGTPAVFLHPADAQHGDLGILRPEDVLLLISNSGKTREILELVDLARQLCPGIPLIVLTGNPRSELAMTADVCLFTGGPAELCPLGLSPTISTTVMSVMGDLLVVCMMDRIQFTAAEYAKRHHGGYLGVVSRRQSER